MFGPRLLNDLYDFHQGIDIAKPRVTPVYSVMSGTVKRAETGTGWLARFGKFVVVAHSNGYQTAYLHLDKFTVKVGQTAGKGTRIGFVGNTGDGIVTYHLHLRLYRRTNGLIEHADSRSPLRILNETIIDTAESVRIACKKTDDQIIVRVTQPDHAIDGVRLFIDPSGNDNERTVDFETREGMDPTNWDNPTFKDVTVSPEDFNTNSNYHIMNYLYAGGWVNCTNCRIQLTDCRGRMKFDQIFTF